MFCVHGIFRANSVPFHVLVTTVLWLSLPSPPAASIKQNGMKNGTENETRFIVMSNVIRIIMGVVLMFIERNYLMQ